MQPQQFHYRVPRIASNEELPVLVCNFIHLCPDNYYNARL